VEGEGAAFHAGGDAHPPARDVLPADAPETVAEGAGADAGLGVTALQCCGRRPGGKESPDLPEEVFDRTDRRCSTLRPILRGAPVAHFLLSTLPPGRGRSPTCATRSCRGRRGHAAALLRQAVLSPLREPRELMPTPAVRDYLRRKLRSREHGAASRGDRNSLRAGARPACARSTPGRTSSHRDSTTAGRSGRAGVAQRRSPRQPLRRSSQHSDSVLSKTSSGNRALFSSRGSVLPQQH